MSRYHDDPLIDAAIRETHVTHSYYASAIGSLRIVADPNVPTMATSAQWVTHYNPTTLRSWTAAERAAVLVHELEHLLRDHAGRCGHRDHAKWNVAADAEINQRLANLPDGAVYPETLGMPRGSSAETYYGAASKPEPEPDAGEGDGSGEGSGQPGPGQSGKPGDGPDCGSAAGGDPRPWESGDKQRPGAGSQDPASVAKQAAEQILGYPYPGTEEGTDLRAWAEAQIGIDRNAWMSALAGILGRSVAQHGAPTRWQWPGRRDPRDLGGAMVPRWTGERPRVAVVIDVSSSITPADLDIARVAAAFLNRHADATFYTCNTRARLIGKVLPESLMGSGGTALRVGIDAAIADGHKAVVVVTDCGTSWGDTDPGIPVIIGANIGARGILAAGPTNPYYPPAWATVVPITQE